MPNSQRSDAVLMYQCRGCAPGGGPAMRWVRPISRRSVIGGLAGLALGHAAAGLATPVRAQEEPRGAVRSLTPEFSYPMGIPGRPLGDGFRIRHGYTCENTIVQQGWWHTAEDWYLADGAETGGSHVYAAAAGEVVFAGHEYPGIVIIVQHAPDLFSSYGHLDRESLVEVGQYVERGQLIGTVLEQVGRRVPSHLHFEIRDFLIRPNINGDSPSHGVHCGLNCPPGPGYWPISDPRLPAELGWYNPTHVINGRAYAGGILLGTEVIATPFAGEAVPVWSAPPGHEGAAIVGDLELQAGMRYRLLAIETGPEASFETSAEAYHVWYQIIVDGGTRVWVQAAVPSAMDTGSDGRPSGITFAFLLAADAT